VIRQPRRDSQQTTQVVSPLRDFLRTETASGVLLAIGAAAAMVWANSPWSSSYEHLWTTSVSLSFGDHALHLALRQWVNEGLITIFFLVVGLEIKRELVNGQLATRRAALLPVAAAIGGMAVPALIYIVIAGGSAPRGWAIVVATDIPLTLGVLAIAGSRVPPSLRIFLLALAVVDDIGALLIIAVFYSAGVGWGWLAAAIVVFGVAVIARRLGLHHQWAFVAIGCLLWLMLHEAGLNATLAGVAMGLLAPSTPRIAAEFVDIEELADISTVDKARTTTDIARGSVSVVEWLEHLLHPWASYVIVPVFALANTGVTLSNSLLHSAIRSPITWAIVVGRVLGKPLGILLAAKLVIGAQLADRPVDAAQRQMLGVAGTAGMGFTVALFITGLAFTDPRQRSDATLGILVAAVVAAAVSLTVLCVGGGRTAARLNDGPVGAPE
jgi:Na+:H+ antiporter, NhaA family